MSKDNGPKQSSDHANGSKAAGTAGTLGVAPPDRRQNGFHSGGASGESAGSARGQQQNGSGNGDANTSASWGKTS
jgi:hypothetical protein